MRLFPDISDRSWLIFVGRFFLLPEHVRVVKTVRVRLPVVDASEVPQLLDLVTGIEGVVGALVDTTTATLEVIVSKAGSALLVREQLRDAAPG